MIYEALPLQIAFEKNNFDLIQLLIENKANLNIFLFNLQTPLTFFISNVHINYIDFLCSKGANVNFKDRKVCLILFF